jgi:TPR repeat protein
LAWSVPAALAAMMVAAVVWTQGAEIAKFPPLSGVLTAIGLTSEDVSEADESYPPAPEEMADQVLVPRLDGQRVPAGATDTAAVGNTTTEFLVERGEMLLRGADAVSARHFFARAAETGNAAAAAAMAASYDPLYLERNAIRGVDADPEQAAAWYRVAIARGDEAAAERLNALLAAPSNEPAPAAPPMTQP